MPNWRLLTRLPDWKGRRKTRPRKIRESLGKSGFYGDIGVEKKLKR
jgi:hypothetical protein